MDKFNEAKKKTRAYPSDAPHLGYLRLCVKEAEAFRDMVKDNGYVHTIPLDDLKFSWEE